MTWPLALFGCVVAVCVAALIDTWIKMPFYRKAVGDLSIELRGKPAVEQHARDIREHELQEAATREH